MIIKDLYSADPPVFRGKLCDGRIDNGQIEALVSQSGKISCLQRATSLKPSVVKESNSL